MVTSVLCDIANCPTKKRKRVLADGTVKEYTSSRKPRTVIDCCFDNEAQKLIFLRKWFHVICTPDATNLVQLTMEAFNCQSCLCKKINKIVASC
jgi:hypothetical protein